ncbi:MAG: flagellin [Phycisphaerae bacterium]
MTRINTNVGSMRAINSMWRNNDKLNINLQRLSTGLKINSGKDAPAALIASETMRSEIAGLRQAIDNSGRANNVLATAEGSLAEVQALILEMQALTNEGANTGALSPLEIEANQLQVDAILDSVNRIANTSQFNGLKLLNGSLDYATTGISSAEITGLRVNAAKLPDNGPMTVAVEVIGSAQLGQITYTGSTVGVAPVTIEIGGNLGVEQLSFTGGATVSSVAFATNALKDTTGVSATVSGGTLVFNSTEYGSNQYVSVRAVNGAFATNTSKDNGKDASLVINGSAAESNGLIGAIRNSALDIELWLHPDFATNPGSFTTFQIESGGSKFQIGSQVNRNGQIHIGIGSVNTTKLGDSTVGTLSTVASGGANSLISGNTVQAQRILNAAIKQISELRGRLGALQRNVLETNISSLSVALENMTASESAIRDSDFAEETAALTRNQILLQASTSVLAQANASPQAVLALLQ